MAETDCLDIAAACAKKAVSLGAEWCDVTAGSSRGISVAIEKSGIKSADAGEAAAVGIRCYINGGMGYSIVAGLEKGDIDRAVERAVAMAREATPDPDFKSLPEPAELEDVPGLFDDAIAGMSVEDVVKIAVENIEAGRAVEAEVNITGGVGLSVTHGAIASSTGIGLSQKTTSIDVSIGSLVKRGDDVGFYDDFDFGRNLADCQLGTVADGATRDAIRFLGARRLPSGKMTLVLGPLAAMGFLASLASACNAESIQRGRSYMCDKLGKRVASERLTLVDDGLIPRGMRSSPFDGEGTRRKRLTLIDGGILAAYLHNSYTAGKAGVETTGHGSQTGGIGPTNLRPTLGTRTEKEILAEVDRGVYLSMGQLSPDAASGDISASIDFGFMIEDGRLSYPVENAMVGGNILDLAQQIDAVSSDYREEPGVIMPTLRLRDVQFAGSGGE